MKKKAIIIDIDGTVADKGERKPHDYQRVLEDKPHKVITNLIQMVFTAEPNWRFIYVSGRPNSCETDTLLWLYNHALPFDSLHMRKDGDYRKDSIVKREIYEQEIEPYYDVQFVLDDRNQVVEMWRSIGLVCLQVADGNF